MITGKFIAGNGDLQEAYGIREEVFVKEQGFPAEIERDEYDARAIHALLYDDDHKPAATGRLYIDNEGFWHLGRICVRKDLRGKQLGDLVMRMMLDKAIGAGAGFFRLSAQSSVEGFYRIYGFTPYGEEYEVCGKPHVNMEATKESIVAAVFSGCRGEKFV